ncbi:hypothetical protein [Brevundimonas sp. M20]|jgi:hypothetical protein|uniref:hypothetical protein n=1 Tax=Brevundimonas sp. M20 TaxID=2591463 RepID=UPI001146BB79|nr:hypothetical protein [Brevundimonas sp. M20]QDH74440.1 hypothetical protein FKQ52_14030 [Brevundimonas sp. M20]
MMSGYVDDLRPGRRGPGGYEVLQRDGGWCVAVNGCRTRALPVRELAEQLARSLQAEADGLHHRREARQ